MEHVALARAEQLLDTVFTGRSSSLCLQNTWSIHNPKQQAIPLALTVGEHLLDGMGAIRVY